MTVRLYAEDVARERGISLRQAHRVVRDHVVGRHQRRRFTTPQALSVGAGDEQRPDLTATLGEAILALVDRLQQIEDYQSSLARQALDLTQRLAAVERRVL